MKKFYRKYVYPIVMRTTRLGRDVREVRDLLIQSELRSRMVSSDNPIVHHSHLGFSQNDEDGIIAEIVRRLGLPDERRTFVELGSGNGLENNSLALLAAGWRGQWIDGLPLADPELERLSKRLVATREWVTRENVVSLISPSLRDHIGLVSMDLDGNDFHLVEQLLLARIRPGLFVVEYNGRFAPGIEFVMPYDPAHTWAGDDFFGASISSWVLLFEQHNYRLVACNVTGVNAFFVPLEADSNFGDVPTELRKLFMPPLHHGMRTEVSLKLARHLLR